MRKFSLMIILLTSIGLLLNSCGSDDDDDNGGNNNPNSSYYPLEIGSYRTYELTGAEADMDSTTVVGMETRGGFEAYQVDSYALMNGNWEMNGSSYYRTEGSKVFVEADYFNSLIYDFIQEPIFGDDWMLVLDPDQSGDEVIFEQDLSGIFLEIPGFSLELKNVTITLMNEGLQNVVTPGYTGDAMLQRVQIQLNARYLIVDIPLNANIDNYYADGIGLVKSDVGAFEIDVQGQKVPLREAQSSDLKSYYVPVNSAE